MTLMNYDAVLTSYTFFTWQYRKHHKYLERIREFEKMEQGTWPERPDLSLFSGIFSWDPEVLSPYLILDEAHIVKNPESLTFKAVYELRKRCDTCLMLSGSPIDNKWPDIYSFLQLAQGHEIRTKATMMRLLGTPDQTGHKYSRPTGERYLRYIQILNALMLRRPESTIQLPQLDEHLWQFDLNSAESGYSNEYFRAHPGT
jgi:SNF2 family DNA or RNA helicase